MCISKNHLVRAQQIWPISNISLCTQRDTAFYRRQCLSLTLLLLNELNIICSIFVFVCCNVCHFGHILILDVLLGCIVSEKMENQKENSNRLDKEMPVRLLSFFYSSVDDGPLMCIAELYFTFSRVFRIQFHSNHNLVSH